MSLRGKKGKKIDMKKIKTVDELDGICDFIRDHHYSTLSMFKQNEARQSHRDFSNTLEILGQYYFQLNSNCQKTVTQSLIKYHKMLLDFLKDTTNGKVVAQLFHERAILTELIMNCIKQLPSQTPQLKQTDTQKVQTLVRVLLKTTKDIFLLNDVQKIFASSPSQTTKFLAMLRDNRLLELKTIQVGMLLPLLNTYSSDIENVFENITIDPEIKNFIVKLLSLWKQNYKKNARYMDENMLANCALLIVKRILLACVLFLKGNLDPSILSQLHPTLPELNTMMKDAYKAPQTMGFMDIMKRLRAKLGQEKPSSQKTRSASPSEQKISASQRSALQFLHSLEQENKKLMSSSRSIPLSRRKTVSTLLQRQQQEKKQQHKMPTTIKQSLRQTPFEFQYVSPGFHHRQTIGDGRLQKRKTQNIPDVQMSLVDENVPHRIMDLAMKGNYTSILLVDVANKRRQFQSQQQMRSRLRQLMPVDLPTQAREKPLFVLVEQTDLDQSAVPKASLDDRLLKKGILQIKVSCVKQTDDGRHLDCYKKQTEQDFTKNPMDDFVLLTLRHSLRSYYYHYMRYWGKDVNLLKTLGSFQQLLSDNPFQVLLQQDQWGQVVRQSYQNVHFDENVPYTWLISDDQWRDWSRHHK